jgi:hypothetical protein
VDHTATVRPLAGLALLVLAVALPAGAATVDPKALVVGRADVPAGFRLDPDETGLRTNEVEARENPETRPLFRRWGRVTGYQARYENAADASIEARVDLFRNANGAHELQRWVVREMARSGIKGVVSGPVRLGSEGRMYSSKLFVILYWRSGRAWSALAGFGVPKSRTLAAARAQQRRIATALQT